MEQPLISIIIPVYNVENYIDDCVKSVLNQTYHNLEIILVNDGSVDSSGKHCDEFAKKDNRVTVIHQKNQGLSAARNAGTMQCHGEYISFVDGDDDIAKDCIEKLWLLTQKGRISYTQCEYGEYLRGETVLHGNQKAGGALSSSQFIQGEAFLTMACGKLIRRELVTNNLFPVGKIHEDVAVMPRMCYEAGTVAYTGESLYFYNERNESINSKSRYYLGHLDILPFIKGNIDFFEQREENEIANKMRRQYVYEMLEQYGSIEETFSDRKDLLVQLKTELVRTTKEIMKDQKIKITTRILLCCVARYPRLWSKVMR